MVFFLLMKDKLQWILAIYFGFIVLDFPSDMLQIYLWLTGPLKLTSKSVIGVD